MKKLDLESLQREISNTQNEIAVQTDRLKDLESYLQEQGVDLNWPQEALASLQKKKTELESQLEEGFQRLQEIMKENPDNGHSGTEDD